MVTPSGSVPEQVTLASSTVHCAKAGSSARQSSAIDAAEVSSNRDRAGMRARRLSWRGRTDKKKPAPCGSGM
ncbi:hypothetical protein [Sphingopyxis indica]|uniref:hypothetical protein n=1 Tax=Sphingopyxis indica TaxID=436663 RepID=UPI000B76E428|nr:hypothetical protein [Sphingopyxis indica]